MKYESLKVPEYPPQSLESFRVREARELFDEESRYRTELIRMSTIHQDKMEEIKARYLRESNAWQRDRKEAAI